MKLLFDISTVFFLLRNRKNSFKAHNNLSCVFDLKTYRIKKIYIFIYMTI